MKFGGVYLFFLVHYFGTSFPLNHNPEEMGDMLEGDILGGNPYYSRSAYTFINIKWPDGVVPYEINYEYPENELAVIKIAMEKFHANTCIRFREKTDTDEDYVLITSKRAGCFSNIGRQGGKQIVNLKSEICLMVGTVEHELMHVLGFIHEQNRIERDDYITVKWDNIQEGKEHNFYKVGPNLTSDFGVPYDYKSIMHYSAYAFSKNNEPTLVPKKKNVVVGLRYGFSEGDIQKVNAMYCSPSV